MALRKTYRYTLEIFAAAALTLLCAGASIAADKWQVVTWNGGADGISRFEALCVSRGMTLSDVLEANGYLPGILPADGEELLVPESKKALLSTWVEVQNRKGGAKPLVTVKLHGVPDFMRGQEATPPSISIPPKTEEAPPVPAPQPAKPAAAAKAENAPVKPVKNMTIVVSGDAIALLVPEKTVTKPETPQDVIRDYLLQPVTAAASRDIIIPDPSAVKPLVTPPSRPNLNGKMMWPVDGEVTSWFGRRGRRRSHHGLDIPMPKDTPIMAALDGTVLETANNRTRRYRGYGNSVLLQHENGLFTLYAHCSKLNVKAGDKIKQGDIIAFVGDTGRTTTHHVHFEVRKKKYSQAVNPVPYLAPR